MSVYSIGDPIIIAHRGGASEHPENTPAAFAANKRDGFTFIETDAHVTRDGIAVLSHDPTLDRTTDSRGRVIDYTWRELSRVKARNGERAIMRVDEALRAYPSITFNIDAKNDAVVAPLITAIRNADAVERVCVASFSESRLVRVRQLLPGVATSLGVTAIVKIVAASRFAPCRAASGMARLIAHSLPMVNAAQIPVVQHGVTVLTPEFITMAHARGMAVHVWTINDVDEAQRILDMGADGIITDIPARMRAELSRRGVQVRS